MKTPDMLVDPAANEINYIVWFPFFNVFVHCVALFFYLLFPFIFWFCFDAYH